MAIFTPANEPRFTFAVAGNEMLVAEFTLTESISAPFEATIGLAAEDEIPFDDVVGKPALLTLESGDETRYVHGIVEYFTHNGMDGRFYLYLARIVPQIKLLDLEQDCRIFQEKSVPDIVEEVLSESGITSDLLDIRLQGNHPARGYCVQYRETDLNFVSRLLEEEGIFYFFEHTDEKHVMVLGDGTVNYQPIAGESKVIFNSGGGLAAEEEAVVDFKLSKQIRTGKYTVKDYNFINPALDLTADDSDSENKKLEVYDYASEHMSPENGKQIAKVRLQQAVMQKETAEGNSVVPRFLPGFTFTLTDYAVDSANKEYLLSSVVHQGAQPQVVAERASSESGTSYTNSFVAVPSSVTIRPEKRAKKPVMEGVQTAIVTGSSGEEIYTDEHGRVKVQFHWDRLGTNDERSSCWIRVSHAWAGAGWGAMNIPRIGHEVIVSFEEGDPDRPIITGRVYHGTNSPPYKLPDDKTKSTLKSDSTIGGGGSNEFRFEDKKGSEEIYLHGQKDWSVVIGSDKNQSIGHDETMTVGNNRTKSVGVDQSETIGSNKSITVGSNHSESVASNMSQTVGVAKSLTIGAAYQVTVGAAMNETIGAAKAEEIGAAKSVNVGASSIENVGKDKSVNVGGKISHDAGKDITLDSGKKMLFRAGDNFAIAGEKKGVIDIKDQLTIKCGSASITLKKNGDITIKGKKINIKGSGNVAIKGSKVTEN
jgi:type VI secretion system secreted protein VgrG